MDLVQAEDTQTEMTAKPHANGLTEAQCRAARLIAMGMGYKGVAGEHARFPGFQFPGRVGGVKIWPEAAPSVDT